MSGSTEINNAKPVATPIASQTYHSADNLRAKFVSLSGPKHLVTNYARLALVSDDHVTLNCEGVNEITRFTLKNAVDEIQMRKELLGELTDIFHHQNKPCPRLILIMGGPGIGKTTIANEICVKWAKGDGRLAENFDIVILIPLQSIQSLEAAMLEHIGEETYEQIKKSAGARSLIILDGWDELPTAYLDKDPSLACLVKDGGTLGDATVMIMSRPHACPNMEADRKIELVGFGEKEIQEFTQKSFSGDAKLVDKFMQQFEEHAYLCTICYTPKTLEMIVNLFQYSHGNLPEVLTKLYQQLIEMLINKRVVMKDSVMSSVTSSGDAENVLRSVWGNIPEEAVGTMLLLSKVSYRSFFEWHTVWDRRNMRKRVKKENGEETSNEGENSKDGKVKLDTCSKHITIIPKIVFAVEDLIQSGISDPGQFNGCGLLITCDNVTYNFAHSAVQDMLCALYVSTLPEQEQYRLMDEYFHYYPNVFVYLCGLTGLKSTDLSQFVSSKLTGGQCERCILSAVHCIYEGQLCKKPQSVSPFLLTLSFNNLQLYDCLCTSHVLSYYPVDRLSLGICFMGDKGVKMLTKIYPKEKDAGGLTQLYLWRNDLTADGMENVMKIVIASSTTLADITIGDNAFGDDAMSMMCKGLQHLHKLTKLNIRAVGLTKKGAYSIGELLKDNCVLETLDLSQNDEVGDDGISVIADALLDNKTLTELWVGECGVTANGVEHIRKALMVNTTLQKLSIHYNNIGDDGISIISEAIKHSKSLTILWAWNCGFSVKGCGSMSGALKGNETLEVLGFSQNSLIGDAGLAAITGVLGNCKVTLLDLHDCGITLAGAKLLAASLKVIQRKFAISLYGNAITVEGARLILQSAVECTAPINVWIDDDYRDDKKVAEMLSVLEERGG